MPLYLEDVAIGQVFRSQGRTITEGDISAFAGLSGDFNPLHTNEVWVREHTPFRGRIAHGLLITSISSGLHTPQLDQLEVLAFLSTTRKMVAPTYPGDTIHVVWTVSDVRESRSNPGRGVVTIGANVVNQNGETVQSGEDVLLVATRPATKEDVQ